MKYRRLPRGGENISILGLGTSSIGMAGEQEIEAAMTMALEAGINFFDMASANAAPFPAYGRAISGMREKLYFQIHFGANYQGGKYGWTTELDTIKRSAGWQLSALGTDYIDFGFLHCIDEEYDLENVLQGGVLEYIQKLQMYEKLEKKAGECIGCGHCDKRCPFHVAQSGRMAEIHAYFGC